MTNNEDSLRILNLERVDLDFRELEKLFDQRMTDFLQSNQTALGLEQERNPIEVWLKRVWPHVAGAGRDKSTV